MRGFNRMSGVTYATVLSLADVILRGVSSLFHVLILGARIGVIV